MSILFIVLLLTCLLGTIYFTLAESALLNFSYARLDVLPVNEAQRELIDRHIDNRNKLILTAAVLNAVCNVLFVILIYWIYADRADGSLGLLGLAGIFGLSVIGIVLLGELLPWSFAVGSAERYLGRFMVPVAVAAWAIRPVLAGITGINRLAARIAGHPEPSQNDPAIEKKILSVVASGEKVGEIEEDQKEMFTNVVEFRDADVAEVMTPRTAMVSLEIDTPLSEAIETGRSTGHSRLPVYAKDRDHIKGILYLRDVLFQWAEKDKQLDMTLAEVIRAPVFVPETKQIAGLLGEMRREKFQIAIVVDEYGGTAGIVTTEDIVEEIVGEIQDEYDYDVAEEIRRVSEDCIEVHPGAHVDDINEALHVSLPEHESYDTISGFVFSHLGRVPKKGETFSYDGVEIAILHADERRIHRLRISAHRQEESLED